MKKILVFIVIIAISLSYVSAFADEEYTIDDIRRFQPYTEVDLEVFINAGYKCIAYDDFDFGAVIRPPVNRISTTVDWDGISSLKTTYAIEMSILFQYNAGVCNITPVLTFSRAGSKTNSDSKMNKVYIKNGENRYIVDASLSTRTKNENSQTQDTLIAPLSVSGFFMLHDLAFDCNSADVRMGEHDALTDVITITNVKAFDAFRNFYSTCETAGVLNQECIKTTYNLYYIKTLHNNTSLNGQEDIIDNDIISSSTDTDSGE